VVCAFSCSIITLEYCRTRNYILNSLGLNTKTSSRRWACIHLKFVRSRQGDIGGEVAKVTEIILARHGETEWNVGEIFRGRIDIELNEAGLRQAQLLAGYLSGVNIDTIYSSPLRRALKTAEVIASYHRLNIEIAPSLIDFDYGKWQGLAHQEVKDKYKELYAEWINNPHLMKMPIGESLGEVRERAKGVVDNIVARQEGTVVLVSHRVVNKVLICALLGLDDSHFWNIRLDTCGITTFTYENGRFILIEHNNTSYLKHLPKPLLSDF
jgi:broad specificity phosphatase PhoE